LIHAWVDQRRDESVEPGLVAPRDFSGIGEPTKAELAGAADDELFQIQVPLM